MAPDRGFNITETQTSNLTDEISSLHIDNPPLEVSSPIITNPSTMDTTSTTEITPPHLSHDPSTNQKLSPPFQFGQRHLDPSADVFAYNAWDHVAPTPSHLAYCEEQYSKQRSTPVSDFDKTRFNTSPVKWWDLFYKQKSATFFKDRKWLFQEFPLLASLTEPNAGRKSILEVGAGAGNTAFPILRANQNPDLTIHAHDFSKKAVETMRASPAYDPAQMRAEVWDVTSPSDPPPGIPPGSVDVVILIFIFSALNPTQWATAIRNIHTVLKPGGQVLFRDYGRGDLAQVRFKAGRWMGENFYVRGDGTRVYFFEREELERLWGGGEGGDVRRREQEGEGDKEGEIPPFTILNLDVDRRLIVNRQRKLTMYRCWIQGQFQKPGLSSSPPRPSVTDGTDSSPEGS